MTHSDDVGLVLPPAVAPTQVVIVPMLPKAPKSGAASATGAGDADRARAAESVLAAARAACDQLRVAGLRVELCLDVHSMPGARFFAWERRGVPIRIEIGSREVAGGRVTAVPRVTGVQRRSVPLDGWYPLGRRRSSLRVDILRSTLAPYSQRFLCHRFMPC